MMHEFVLFARSSTKSAKPVDHPPTDSFAYPNIAIYDPDNITLRLSISPAHVPNLWIWSQVVDTFPIWLEQRILFLDEDACTGVGKIRYKLLQGWVARIASRGDAKIDGQFVGRIVLTEGRGQTIIQIRLEAFDGSDRGNMGSVGGSCGVGFPGSLEKVSPSV